MPGRSLPEQVLFRVPVRKRLCSLSVIVLTGVPFLSPVSMPAETALSNRRPFAARRLRLVLYQDLPKTSADRSLIIRLRPPPPGQPHIPGQFLRPHPYSVDKELPASRSNGLRLLSVQLRFQWSPTMPVAVVRPGPFLTSAPNRPKRPASLDPPPSALGSQGSLTVSLSMKRGCPMPGPHPGEP